MKEEYLTDEELMELINEVEANSMLKAPAYMKERILHEIQKEELRVTQNAPSRQSITTHKKNIRKQLLVYEIKVMGSMAAAILILFLLPVSVQGEPEMNQEGYYSQADGILFHCNETLDRFLQHLDTVADGILHPQNLWNKVSDESDRQQERIEINHLKE